MKARGKISIMAMLLGQCPRCRRGKIFRPLFSGGVLAMNPRCEVCGLEFDRESGYFVGAMYFSYTIGVLTVVPVALALVLFFDVSQPLAIAVAVVQTLFTMVFAFRYGRIIWIHIDEWLDPR